MEIKCLRTLKKQFADAITLTQQIFPQAINAFLIQEALIFE